MQLITPFFLRKTFSRAFAFHFPLERKETKLSEHDDDDGRYRWARCENKTRFLLFLIERDTRTHTHKSREREFFFSFACFLLITLSISLKPYTLLLCFFLRPLPKSHSISLFYFFSAAIFVSFFLQTKDARTHTRERKTSGSQIKSCYDTRLSRREDALLTPS